MWQADTLHGPYLRINNTTTKTYLLCFIDDASRVVPHGAFYTSDSTPNLINCFFQTALYKRGVPQALYVDKAPTTPPRNSPPSAPASAPCSSTHLLETEPPKER